MKFLVFISIGILLIACNQNSQTQTVPDNSIDLVAELEAIEVTRSGFIKAIDEKRYNDLANWSTPELIQLVPNDAPWNAMINYRMGAGLFPYDSIRMQPIETVVLSDTMAYDFGQSTVFFTDSLGQTQRLKDTYLAILKKDSLGRWRLHREVANSRLLDGN